MKVANTLATVGACVVSVATGFAAETSPETGPELEALLGEAMANNAGLQSAYHTWQAAEERAEGIDALPDPRFSYAYFIDEVETRVGPQEQKFAVSQQLPWFGTLGSKEQMARDHAAALNLRLEEQRLRVFHEVKRAFYEYYYLGRAIAITEENIQLLSHLEGVAQARYKTGAPVSSVIQAQVELGLLDDRLQSLLDSRKPMSARLRAAVNRQDDSEIPIPRHATFHRLTLDEDAMLGGLEASSPEIRAMDAMVRAEEAGLALAQNDARPTVSLGLEYIDTGEARMQAVPDSGKDAVIAQVSVSLPVWLSRNRSAVREAQQRRLAAEHAREGVRDRLEADLVQALYEFKDADRKVRLYEEALIPQTRQALNVSEESYRAGAVDFLNLIDAQRRFLEFQLARERARADREIRLAQIEMLSGVEVPMTPISITEE